MAQYLATGIYDPAEVVSSTVRMTGTGKESLEIVFRDGSGALARWTGYFTEKAWAQTERALIALGWDPYENDLRFDLLNGTTVLVGRRAQIDVRVETYKRDDGSSGEISKVRWINECGNTGPVREGMAQEDAAKFASDLRSRLLAGGGPEAAKKLAEGRARAKAKPAAAPPPLSAKEQAQFDDDIPF